jgi:hypothetical protein
LFENFFVSKRYSISYRYMNKAFDLYFLLKKRASEHQ